MTDEEVLQYYERLLETPRASWLEIVEGMMITRVLLTSRAIAILCDHLAAHRHELERVRAALVAPSGSVVFGVFRVWQAAMELHGFEAAVFEEFDAAQEWLLDGA